MKTTTLVITCEHAVNHIPQVYQKLFKGKKSLLNSHSGWDIGAEAVSDHLHQIFKCEYHKATVSRLIIDCNRNLTHPKCFSEFTRSLSKETRQAIKETYYFPFRQKAEKVIEDLINTGQQVLHLSVHSFTPSLNGQERNADIGLLYDSRRHGEKEVARLWHGLISSQPYTSFRTRKNYPYNGRTDGFTSSFRKRYTEENYLGIELEFNQTLGQDKQTFQLLLESLSDSLKELLQLL